MFYSFEWVCHRHICYHDKATLTVLKGVSKDFCQGTPLGRRVSGCHSVIVQRCALVQFPILQAERRWSILHATLEMSGGGIFGAYFGA